MKMAEKLKRAAGIAATIVLTIALLPAWPFILLFCPDPDDARRR